MSKILKNKKGMTLVEVIIASALVTVVLGGILSMLVPALNLFHEQFFSSEFQNTAEQMSTDISQYIRYARNEIKALDSINTTDYAAPGTVCIYQEGYDVKVNGKTLQAGLMNDKDAHIVFTIEDKSVSYTLELYAEGGEDPEFILKDNVKNLNAIPNKPEGDDRVERKAICFEYPVQSSY